MSDNKKNLYYLEELSDYKVANDYSDVRGWEIIDAENRIVGKVSNLLVSKPDERVVYLDVEVDKSLIEFGYDSHQIPASDGVHGFINKDGDDHLIVPIGMVIINPEQKKVITNQIDFNTFARAKRFSKGAGIDREYELISLKHYLRDYELDAAVLDKEFYNRKEFETCLDRKVIEKAKN